MLTRSAPIICGDNKSQSTGSFLFDNNVLVCDHLSTSEDACVMPFLDHSCHKLYWGLSLLLQQQKSTSHTFQQCPCWWSFVSIRGRMCHALLRSGGSLVSKPISERQYGGATGPLSVCLGKCPLYLCISMKWTGSLLNHINKHGVGLHSGSMILLYFKDKAALSTW